jgi:hypothetical protein
MKTINFDDSQFMLVWYCINLVLMKHMSSTDEDMVALKELLHDLVDDVYKQAHGEDYDSRTMIDFPMCE